VCVGVWVCGALACFYRVLQGVLESVGVGVWVCGCVNFVAVEALKVNERGREREREGERERLYVCVSVCGVLL